MPLGLYLSVPFCRTKCSFCNFASGVFSRPLFDQYVRHLESELARSEQIASEMGSILDRELDSIYLGGGTPSVLAPDQLAALFRSVRQNFSVLPNSEITVEVAPGTLSPEILQVLVDAGVNRVSLGMQSFVDQETRSVGRLHNRDITLRDIANLRTAGIHEISVDLIVGLPHQTADSWTYSLSEVLAIGVPHVSVYMLEVDDDSRLGRELIAGGTRYHAHHVPNDDATADFYLQACETLGSAALHQYEISNFARDERSEGAESKDLLSRCDTNSPDSPLAPDLCHAECSEASLSLPGLPSHASRHNLKYWVRHPYLGFGVDAHSMLSAPRPGEPHAAVRLATNDNLDALLAGASLTRTAVSEKNAIEELYFLGLRLNRGLELVSIAEEYGIDAVERYRPEINELTDSGLLTIDEGWLRLTNRGRLLSNDVFSAFLSDPDPRPSAKIRG
jgi:oxygen-independent coproporphyrinogen-3 oxidase